MNKRIGFSVSLWRLCSLLVIVPAFVWAQQLQPSVEHGFYDHPFTLSLTGGEGFTVRYTLDGSEPTARSEVYGAPLTVSGTTILRASAFDGEKRTGDILTATYIFVDDVLSQSNTPAGYPQQWGEYTQIRGTAIADYEMDPEMTSDPLLRPKIADGLKSLAVVSIVTDKDNLFSHDNDPDKGGIYIFTGPPVGDATGHGWTRPASLEIFGQGHDDMPLDVTVGCGLRLHGGHGRLAEKNPKHSFRLVFKEQYGPKTLKYPLFGPDEPDKYDQLVLRCHFGNAWQHWAEGNRQKAQYTRDVWARRMQRRLGRTSVNALYVNLFLNGMYWGLYNLAERVDDQYGKDHLGGKKEDIDVVKIEEDGGNHLEAAEGTLDAWQTMVSLCRVVGGTASPDITPDEAYTQLQDSLLDIDAFIDYMLINQYGGNTDWDHHNWYALRRHGDDSQGFRFLCWDSEIIMESERENVLSKNNGSAFPTGIFQNLLHNDDFAHRYVRRAKELLADDGALGQASVVEVWDSLYLTISKALYAEAARWGDYRRDVHPWQSKGKLYTVDDTYMAERNRLLTQYFPYRSDYVLQSILNYVDIDDFELPDGWQPLVATMFHEWDGAGANANPEDKTVSVAWHFGVELQGGETVAGFPGVDHNQFADLSGYERLMLCGNGGGLRILTNRLVAHGEWKQIVVNFNESDPYWDADLQAIVVPLDEFRTMKTTSNNQRSDNFVHLHALKVDWSSTCNVRGAYLLPSDDQLHIEDVGRTTAGHTRYYNLQGQPVDRPVRGLYIKDGRKYVVK